MLYERYGMPMAWTPPPVHAASIEASRAVVAARAARAGPSDRAAAPPARPELRRPRARRSGDDRARRDRGRDRRRPRSPAGCARTRSRPRCARTCAPRGRPSPASRAQDYKLGGPPEERRYTCPSYELERSAPPPEDWPTANRVDLPGFRPVEAYEAAIANLAPELTRRADPEDADDGARVGRDAARDGRGRRGRATGRWPTSARSSAAPRGSRPSAGTATGRSPSRPGPPAGPQLLTPSVCCRLDERHAGMAAGGRDPARRRSPEGRRPHRYDGGARGVRDPRAARRAGLGRADRRRGGARRGDRGRQRDRAPTPPGCVLAGFLLVQVDRARAGERRRAVRLLRRAAGGSRAPPPARTALLAVACAVLPALGRRTGAARSSPPRRPPPRSCVLALGRRERAARRARARRRGAAARPGEPARRLVRRRRRAQARAVHEPGLRAVPQASRPPRTRCDGVPVRQLRRGRGAGGVGRRRACPARRSRSRSGPTASCSPRAR